MEGEGPSAGTPVQLGTLLASDDPLAMDLSVCRMLHIEPIGIPILKRARLRSLWPASVTYPLLTPEDVAHPGFVLPQTAGYLLTGKKQPKKHPMVTGQCTGCGQCAEICPKHAITTATGKAAVDLDTCIRCYCCQEICPEKAIVLTDQDT
jgi:formate hydrogenlyase subunit 6/NADH:ubiquinone oxidoreductase subunit I